MLLVASVCRWAAAIGGVAAFALALTVLWLPPVSVAAWRTGAMAWAGGYLFVVGGMYVFVSTTAPPSARLSGNNVNVFAGLPKPFTWLAPTVTALCFAAFFIAIALVESGRVPRMPGEVAILGAFSMGAYAAMFSGCWTAQRHVRGGVA